MGPSFYEFIIRFMDHDADDPMSRLANAVSLDMTFPKHSDSFSEISEYMELSSHYTKLLSIFDTAWQKYQEILS